MPRTEEVYRILLASPSDLADERSAAADAVDEINKTRSNFLLELLTWETHAPPGVGEHRLDGPPRRNRSDEAGSNPLRGSQGAS